MNKEKAALMLRRTMKIPVKTDRVECIRVHVKLIGKSPIILPKINSSLALQCKSGPKLTAVKLALLALCGCL